MLVVCAITPTTGGRSSLRVHLVRGSPVYQLLDDDFSKAEVGRKETSLHLSHLLLKKGSKDKRGDIFDYKKPE